MFRTKAQPCGWLLDPMLAAGLSLLHYPAFTELPSHLALKNRLSKAHPKLLELGIHVLVSQHGHGKITVGDPHEYEDSPSMFYQKEIEDLIRSYLSSFSHFALCAGFRTLVGQVCEPPLWGTLDLQANCWSNACQ